MSIQGKGSGWITLQRKVYVPGALKVNEPLPGEETGDKTVPAFEFFSEHGTVTLKHVSGPHR